MRARQYVAVASAFIFNLFKAEDLGIESSCCRQKWPLDAPNVWQKVLGVSQKRGPIPSSKGGRWINVSSCEGSQRIARLTFNWRHIFGR